jgi:hypothetical protein
MSISPEIENKLALLQEKYEAMGQDMSSYLDGLLHADFLTYWDYIHLDTLLSLQSPKTPFPDEEIFIMYHQITELYFKLSLHECKQIAAAEPLSLPSFSPNVCSALTAISRRLPTPSRSWWMEWRKSSSCSLGCRYYLPVVSKAGNTA